MKKISNKAFFLMYIFSLSVLFTCKLPSYNNMYSFYDIFNENNEASISITVPNYHVPAYDSINDCLIVYDNNDIIYLYNSETLEKISEVNWNGSGDYKYYVRHNTKQILIVDNKLFILGRGDCVVYSISDPYNPIFLDSIKSVNNMSFWSDPHFYGIAYLDNMIILSVAHDIGGDVVLYVIDPETLRIEMSNQLHENISPEGIVISDNKIYMFGCTTSLNFGYVDTINIYELNDDLETPFLNTFLIPPMTISKSYYHEEILLLEPEDSEHEYLILKLGGDELYKLIAEFNSVTELDTFNFIELDFNFNNIIIGSNHIFDYRDENNIRLIAYLPYNSGERKIRQTFSIQKKLYLFDRINYNDETTDFVITKCEMKS